MTGPTEPEPPTSETEPDSDPAPRFDQSGKRKVRRIIFVVGSAVVALSCVAAFFWWPKPSPTSPGAVGLSVDRSVKPVGPIEITGAGAHLIWRDHPSKPVSIRVHNRTKTAARTKVWWTLADPAEKEPWLHNAMQSQPVVVEVAGGKTDTIDVPVPPGAVEPGFYRLSVWAHTFDERADAWVHSDGRAVLGSIEAVAPGRHMLHVNDYSDELWIAKATPPAVSTTGATGQVRIRVMNARPESQVVEAWWYLAPKGTTEPWKSPGAFRSETVTAGADGGAATDIVVPMAALPRPGRYQISVWLHRKSAETSEPVDGVFLADPFVVTASR